MNWDRISKILVLVSTGLLSFFGIILSYLAITILIQAEKLSFLRTILAKHGTPAFSIGTIMILTSIMLAYAILNRKPNVLKPLIAVLFSLSIIDFYIASMFDTHELVFLNIIEKLEENTEPITAEMEELQKQMQCCGIFGTQDYKTKCTTSDFTGCAKKIGNVVLGHLMMLEVAYIISAGVTVTAAILLMIRLGRHEIKAKY